MKEEEEEEEGEEEEEVDEEEEVVLIEFTDPMRIDFKKQYINSLHKHDCKGRFEHQ